MKKSLLFTLLVLCLFSRGSYADKGVRVEQRMVVASGKRFRCTVVHLNLRAGHLRAQVVTPERGIGRTESFSSMIRRVHPIAAVNGSFFEAYKTVGDKDPGMTLIHNGQVIHKGTLGTVIGFAPEGVVMGRLDLPIRGTVIHGNHRADWYAYWINRTPSAANNIALFTPAHGARTRTNTGLCVVVRKDRVVDLRQGDTPIPPDGYVIHLRGQEIRQASKFPIGAQVSYIVQLLPERNLSRWQTVQEALGAGPRLVTEGLVTLDPAREGFHDPKIVQGRGLRNAIGVSQKGELLLVTVGGPTIPELAQVMRSLGAYDAMNLDGGASAGLYVQGRMLTVPGRELSNALMFLRD